MAEKPDTTRNAGKGKKEMPRSMPKKRPSSLWEWQRYVKKETQRIIKGQDLKTYPEPERKPAPQASQTTRERQKEWAEREVKTTEPVKKYRDEIDVKPLPNIITEEDIDDIEEMDGIEQDLDILMSESEVELDDTLKTWVKPETAVKPLKKTAIQKPLVKKEEVKAKAKASIKTKPGKSETLQLFEEQVEKARRKRNPRRTREHLIENLLDPVISLDEAAVILNVCKTTVRRYTNAGKLECIRTPGNQRRFRLSTVLEFLEEKEGTKGIH